MSILTGYWARVISNNAEREATMKMTVQVITVGGDVSSVVVEDRWLDVKVIVAKALLRLNLTFADVFQAIIVDGSIER